MIPSGQQRVATVLSRSSERALQGSLRNILYGVCAAVFLIVLTTFLGNVAWWTFQGYLLVGVVFAFAGWGAERLWYSTIAPMLRNPFSVLGYATRVPFWYFGGGISYTLGLLYAGKFGLLGVWDQPVAGHFDFGGRIGCLMQIPLQLWQYKLLRSSDPR